MRITELEGIQMLPLPVDHLIIPREATITANSTNVNAIVSSRTIQGFSAMSPWACCANGGEPDVNEMCLAGCGCVCHKAFWEEYDRAMREGQNWSST